MTDSATHMHAYVAHLESCSKAFVNVMESLKFYQWVPMTTEVDWCRCFIFLLVSSQIDLSSVKYFFPIWSSLHCHQSPFFGKSHGCFKLQLHSASRSWGLGLGPQWLGKSMLYAVPFDLQIHKYTAVNRLKVRFCI